VKRRQTGRFNVVIDTAADPGECSVPMVGPGDRSRTCIVVLLKRKFPMPLGIRRVINIRVEAELAVGLEPTNLEVTNFALCQLSYASVVR
jgi:hypothetical protein